MKDFSRLPSFSPEKLNQFYVLINNIICDFSLPWPKAVIIKIFLSWYLIGLNFVYLKKLFQFIPAYFFCPIWVFVFIRFF